MKIWLLSHFWVKASGICLTLLTIKRWQPICRGVLIRFYQDRVRLLQLALALLPFSAAAEHPPWRGGGQTEMLKTQSNFRGLKLGHIWTYYQTRSEWCQLYLDLDKTGTDIGTLCSITPKVCTGWCGILVRSKGWLRRNTKALTTTSELNSNPKMASLLSSMSSPCTSAPSSGSVQSRACSLGWA